MYNAVSNWEAKFGNVKIQLLSLYSHAWIDMESYGCPLQKFKNNYGFESKSMGKPVSQTASTDFFVTNT